VLRVAGVEHSRVEQPRVGGRQARLRLLGGLRHTHRLSRAARPVEARRAGDDAVEVAGKALRLFEALASAGGAAREVREPRRGGDALRGGDDGVRHRDGRQAFTCERGNQQVGHLYTRSILDPMRQRISYGIVPICAAISRTSIRSPSCDPMITTSSPGDTSRPVTSAISMSMQTEPTIGARRPRIRTAPHPASRRSRPSAYPAGTIAIVVGRPAWNLTP